MMSAADKLLVAILKYKDDTLLFRVKDEWFDTSEIPKLRFVLDYIGKHDELVGVKTFCSTYSLDASEADSRPGVYFRQVRERYLFTEVADKVPDIIKNAKKNPSKSVKDLAELVSKLSSDEDVDSIDVRYSENADDRVDKYKTRVANSGITYSSMGNPILDEIFMGYTETDLITIGGRAGSKKTFMLCYLAILADEVLPEQFGNITFLTNEMSIEQIIDRMDCIRFHLPFGDFLRGRLLRPDVVRYRKGTSSLTKSRIVFMENVYTMDEYHQKMKIYRPGLAFIDGSYLMEPEYKGDDWKRITYITRRLKRIAKTMKIPHVNTTQLKRASGGKQSSTSFGAQDDFAYASSYTQDSDVAIKMYADKEMQYRNEVGMEIAKGRNIDVQKIPVFVANLVKMDFHFILTDANGDETEPPVNSTLKTNPAKKSTKVTW